MPVTETNYAAPPSFYEAYVYQFTNLRNNKKYLGSRKGSVDDKYQHSSTSDEFAEAYQKDSLKYEVLYYGSHVDMLHEENVALEKVDAKNNPEWYNKHNGQRRFEDIDYDKVNALYDQIIDGIFPTKLELLEDHLKMDRIQQRSKDDAEHQRDIAQTLESCNYDVENCFGEGKGLRVIVLEKSSKNGEDIRVDGSHSVGGAKKSKHVREIPVTRIPFEDCKDFTRREKVALGLKFNQKDLIRRKEISMEDGIKFVYYNYMELGIPYNSTTNIKGLKNFGFKGSLSKAPIQTILKHAKNKIDAETPEESGTIWKDWKAVPFCTELSDRVTRWNSKPNWCCIYMSSGSFRPDRIMELLYNNRAMEEGEIDKLNCKVFIHHPDKYTKEEVWEKKDKLHWIPIMRNLIDKKYNIDIVELDHHVEDEN